VNGSRERGESVVSKPIRQLLFIHDVATNDVYSQYGSQYCVPVLDYEAIGEGGDFTKPFKYSLEKFDSIGRWTPTLQYTRKIPTPIKNAHRAFWGLKPLPLPIDEWRFYGSGGSVKFDGNTVSFNCKGSAIQFNGEVPRDARRELSYLLRLECPEVRFKVPNGKGGNFVS
jgi:hypothetical protein